MILKGAEIKGILSPLGMGEYVDRNRYIRPDKVQETKEDVKNNGETPWRLKW